jgi:nicotinate-nucleotide adenylyltransferase
MNLGLFGGTFDPPHLGHLILAEEARTQFNLEKVLWLVAGQSPLKLDRQLSPVEMRVEMVSAAIKGNPHFALSRVDVDRPAPHYTVETLHLLRQEFPHGEFYFLMGEDSLRDLPKWRAPQAIIKEVRLVVLRRPNTQFDLTELETQVSGVSARVLWLNAPQLEIASSDIQLRIKEGRSVQYMLPREVLEVIEREGLYK